MNIPTDSSTYLDPKTFLGMTLRDYFAAAAMQAIMNSKFYSDMSDDIGWQEIAEWHNLAEECFGVADAMLKAREEKNDC
jgi:hypothetical protein